MARYTVRNDNTVSGYNAKNQRLGILSGERVQGVDSRFFYEVEIIVDDTLPAIGERPHGGPPITALIFKGAERATGGDLIVRISEYPALANFPFGLANLLEAEV